MRRRGFQSRNHFLIRRTSRAQNHNKKRQQDGRRDQEALQQIRHGSILANCLG